MKRHIANYHSAEAELEQIQRQALKFSFVLLPPGNGGLRDTIERYKKLSRAQTQNLFDADFDWERLETIERFNPIARYVGARLWKGYVVFEFQQSDRVILECPKTGNATYILKGEWRKMVSATKAELRSEYRLFTTRITHTSGWETHVRQAVFAKAARSQSPLSYLKQK